MVNNPTKEDANPKADRKLVKAYKVMLSIVADWEQSEYSESIEGNSGCQTEERQLNDLANPTSDIRTQQG
ncbi:MAG: hypothetical protein AAFQ07_03705 [Chloroflexota bacterium]